MKKIISLFTIFVITLSMNPQSLVLADDMQEYYKTQYPDYYGAMYEAYDSGYIYVFGDYYGKTFKDPEIYKRSGFAYEVVYALWSELSISTDIPEVKESIERFNDGWHNYLVYDYHELEYAIEKKFNGCFGMWDMINTMDYHEYIGADVAGYLYFLSLGRGEGDYGAYIVVDEIQELTDKTAYCEWHVENAAVDSEDYPSPEMYAVLERDSINGKGFISYKYLGVNPLTDSELISYSYDVSSSEKITVMIDGVEVQFDQPPIIYNDRTLVPLRAIFEALGATVTWDGDTQTVTAVRGKTTIKLTIGAYEFYKNDERIELDVPGMIINDRTLVPVRAISESFNCAVSWSGYDKTVFIYQRADNSNILETFEYDPQIEEAINIADNSNSGVSDEELQILFDCVGIANVKDYFDDISVFDVSRTDKSALDFLIRINDSDYEDKLEAYMSAIEQIYGERHGSPMVGDISWTFGDGEKYIFLTYDIKEHMLYISWSNDYFFNRAYYMQEKNKNSK